MRASLVLWALTLTSCGRPPDASPAPGRETTGGSPASAAQAMARRVWSGPHVDFLGSPTPDGRFFSHVDPNGDLALRDLATGETRVLAGKAVGSDFRFATSSSVSPDGERVAFVCWNEGLGYQVRVVGTDGAGERTVFGNGRFIEYLVVHGWSPDGRELLALLTADDGSNRIVTVSLEDGGLRTLRSLDWRWPFALDLSPDGRHLAYDLPAEQDSPARDVFVLALDGNAEVRVTDHPGDDRLLSWSPDGKGLLVASDRGGSEAIWRLPMAAGKPAGEPVLVRPGAWGVRPIGRSSDAVFFGVTVQDSRVHTAVLDGEGRVVGEPTPVSEISLGLANSPAWSPDGTQLAYAVRQVGAGGPSRILVRSLATGALREIPGPLGSVRRLVWAPDGRAIVLVGDHRGRQGFFRVDLETAELRALAPHISGPFVQVAPVLSPDGGTLYAYRHDPDTRQLSLVALELASGRERTLRPDATVGTMGLALSPDGGSLAYVGPAGALLVLAVQGGEPRLVHRLPAGSGWGQQALSWTPDGRSLLYTAVSHQDEADQRLYRVPVGGGEPELLGRGEGFGFPRIQPDGRLLAFTSGRYLGEVWVLKEPGRTAGGRDGSAPAGSGRSR